MKTVLVPVDFSEQSICAFRFALNIAHRSRGTVHLLHVISSPSLQDLTLSRAGTCKEPLVRELKAVATQKYKRLIAEFNSAKVRVQTVIRTGRIQSSILDYIREVDVDLVVMGTRGASGIREWMIGSNAERVVRTSPVPVIAVKSNHPDTIKNIVFPNTLDTEDQEDLIMKVKSLQHFFQAKLHIIWINTPALSQPENEVRLRLQAFASRFMLRDYTINVFNYTDEESGIIEFTNQINGDLIAMGTHGLKGIAHMITGSVAEDVVNHVQYPVWTYCAKSARTFSNTKDK